MPTSSLNKNKGCPTYGGALQSLAGGLSNLSIAFTQMKIGGYGSGDVVDIIHGGGTIRKNYATSTNSSVLLPASTSNFTLDTTSGKANLQGYTIQITAVPEPSTALLCGIGVLGLLRRKR